MRGPSGGQGASVLGAGQGATILGCAGLTLAPEEAAFFAEAQPWGFILFARNIDTPEQIRALCADLRAAVARHAPILIDQEGGRVQRLRAPLWREHLPPLDQVTRAAAPERAARAMWLRGRLIAEELHALGIDVNCAPCADVARPDTHPFLYNRCYGTDPASVVAMSRAIVAGQAAGGVAPVLKHIPGHGAAQVDSHLDLPRVDLPLKTLWEVDFTPFKALADLPMAMTAHIIYSAIDPAAPATQSAAMIDLIRGEMGFDGLLMSDDISMQALSGDVAARSAAAMAAGCDLILHCNGDMAEMQAVAAAAGRLSPPAQARADRAMAAIPAPQPFDAAAGWAELQALSQA